MNSGRIKVPEISLESDGDLQTDGEKPKVDIKKELKNKGSADPLKNKRINVLGEEASYKLNESTSNVINLQTVEIKPKKKKRKKSKNKIG